MKIVLDTNALISSVIATGVPHEVVVKGFSSDYHLIYDAGTTWNTHMKIDASNQLCFRPNRLLHENTPFRCGERYLIRSVVHSHKTESSYA